MQSRRWCFTVNNATAEEKEALNLLFTQRSATRVSYLTYGNEIGENGTPHLQGYLEVEKKLRLGGVKQLPGLARAHLERSLGTGDQAAEYCHKDGNYVEYGERMRSGATKASAVLTELLENNAPILTIQQSVPLLYCRYYRGIDRFIQNTRLFKDHDVPRNFKSQVYVYEGPTGTGKSKRAHDINGVTYTHGGDRWFDGYGGDEVILFDDFDGCKSGIPFRKLLQLCDRYPLRVPVKGGFQNFRPKIIIFTTNVSPHLWYADETFAPLERRIDLHLKFTGADIFDVLKGNIEPDS